MSRNSRAWFAVLALCSLAWFAAAQLETSPAAAAAAPANPATLSDFGLCDAFHETPTDALAAEIQSRHILTDLELNAARGHQLFVGMKPLAVVCALGLQSDDSKVVTADGTIYTWVFNRQGARPIIVQHDGLAVASFAM